MDWALKIRDRVEQQVLALAEQLGAWAEQRNRHAEALEYAGRVLEIDACHQNAHLLMMKSQLALNRPEAALKQFQAWFEADGFEHLPIIWQHRLLAGSYPQEHRDPFDRMLAAQSEIEKAMLVSCDAAFGAFKTNVLW